MIKANRGESIFANFLSLIGAGLTIWLIFFDGWNTIYNIEFSKTVRLDDHYRIEHQSLNGFTLGQSYSDVVFRHGNPVKTHKNSKYWLSPAGGHFTEVMFHNNKVVMIIAPDIKSPFGSIDIGTDIDEVFRIFGQGKYETKNNGLRRVYYYPEYNLIFNAGQGKVLEIAVYNPTIMKQYGLNP